jgi:hypothetical protein
LYTNKKGYICSTNKIRHENLEDAIKFISKDAFENDHKIILNIMYTQNVITDKFNDILKP